MPPHTHTHTLVVAFVAKMFKYLPRLFISMLETFRWKGSHCVMSSVITSSVWFRMALLLWVFCSCAECTMTIDWPRNLFLYELFVILLVLEIFFTCSASMSCSQFFNLRGPTTKLQLFKIYFQKHWHTYLLFNNINVTEITIVQYLVRLITFIWTSKSLMFFCKSSSWLPIFISILSEAFLFNLTQLTPLKSGEYFSRSSF